MPAWIEEIKERLQKAQFVDGNPDEPNLDAKFYPEKEDDYRSFVVLGDHPCGEDDVNAVIEVHTSPDNDGIAQWITHAYNGDIAKLIQAVEVAEKALKHSVSSCGCYDGWIVIESSYMPEKRECRKCKHAREALAQLQSGEFPVTADE